MNKYFYITTTAPYINAPPHIGFALEAIQADTIARFKRLTGYQVIFGYGTDEHGLKIYRKAKEEGQDPQTYCNNQVKNFEKLKSLLNLSNTHFIRTTDNFHIKAAQEFWRRCAKNGDIYKKNYKVKYCVGCEMEKTDSELVDNHCPLHPNLEIEIYEEENYFFRFSKYQKKLLDFYEKNPYFVIPSSRFNEIKTFVKKGLKDFSISRLKKKMPWGIDVPGDPNHVMYVWFDALVFYLSNIGWPKKIKTFKQYWPAVQIAGKDNLRQQTAIWQAMLMSANLPLTSQIFIHGFITHEGQKMSKSLGNVVDPFSLVKTYGTDAVRFYLLKEIPPFEDGDFSHQKMKKIYNAYLSNELGNLVSRLTNLGEKDKLKIDHLPQLKFENHVKQLIESYQFNLALEKIWGEIKKLNIAIDHFAPWEKSPKERKNFITESLLKLRSIAFHLQPFIPQTAEKIIKTIRGKIKKKPPLFPRLK